MRWAIVPIKTRLSIRSTALAVPPPHFRFRPCRLIPLFRRPREQNLVPGGVQPDIKTPTLISWSLRIQQEVSPNTSLTLGYVGSHGYHEIIGIDANEPFPVICPASPCPATYPNITTLGVLAGAPVPAGTYYVPTTREQIQPSQIRGPGSL